MTDVIVTDTLRDRSLPDGRAAGSAAGAGSINVYGNGADTVGNGAETFWLTGAGSAMATWASLWATLSLRRKTGDDEPPPLVVALVL